MSESSFTSKQTSYNLIHLMDSVLKQHCQCCMKQDCGYMLMKVGSLYTVNDCWGPCRIYSDIRGNAGVGDKEDKFKSRNKLWSMPLCISNNGETGIRGFQRLFYTRNNEDLWSAQICAMKQLRTITPLELHRHFFFLTYNCLSRKLFDICVQSLGKLLVF